jgi:WD40 repeat protein
MMFRCAFTVCAAFFLASSVRAQMSAKAGTDFLGDPLPSGAVARLGTMRFKHPGGPNLSGANLPLAVTVTAVRFSPDGKKIASVAVPAGTVRLWDAATGKEWPGLWSARVYGCDRTIAFSPDGTLLAVYGKDLKSNDGEMTIMLFDVAGGKLLRSLRSATAVWGLDFVDGGKTIVTTDNEVVRWWDVATGKEQRSWKPFADVPPAKEDQKTTIRYGLSLSPGAKYLLVHVGKRDAKNELLPGEEVVVFDPGAGKECWRIHSKDRPGNMSMTFSADNQRLVIGFGTDKLEMRDAGSGKLVAALPVDAPFDRKTLSRPRALSADGGTLAFAGLDSRIFVWHAKEAKWRAFSARIAQPESGSTRCVAFSPDGKKLLVGVSSDLQLYDVATLKEVYPFDGHRDWVDYVAFSADGKRLLTASAQWDLDPREVATWEVGTWKRLSVTSSRESKWPNIGILSPEHTGYTGKTGDDRLNLYDFASGKQVGRLQVPDKKDPDDRGFFAPGGKFFVQSATGGDRLYAVPSGKLLFPLPKFYFPSPVPLRSVAFSADGRLVAVHAMNTAIYVFETATGKQVQRLGRQPEADEYVDFAHLVFSADGNYLASWTDLDHTIRLWDLTTGKERWHFADPEKHTAVFFAFSPDGRMLAVGAARKIQVWELATHKIRCEFTGHQAEVRALAFSPDSRLLASGSADTTVLIWDVTGR